MGLGTSTRRTRAMSSADMPAPPSRTSNSDCRGQSGIAVMWRFGILERQAILRETADEILARKDELGRLLSLEVSKMLIVA